MSATESRPGTGAWISVALGLAVALLLPVDATATWLNATYGARPSDVALGVWIFKAALAALMIAAVLLKRMSAPSGVHAQQPPPSRATMVILGAILVLAFVLRLYRIDTELWLDEILMRERYIPLDFRQLISTYDSQNNQPLYSLLSRVAFLVLGESDWSIRVPAVVFGVASLGAVWWFARQVTSTTEATLAAFILACSYHHVWFSQNARGYTTMMFLAVLASGLFIRLCEGGGEARRLAWGYAVLMALATYTHLTAALIAVGHALALLLTLSWTSAEGRRRALWPMVALGLSALVTVCLYGPMLPQVIRQVSQPTMQGVAVAWTGIGWLVRESLRVLSAGIPGGVVTVLVALSVLGIGFVSYWRRSRLTTLVMFLPVAVTMATLLATSHNLWPRFFFFASGFFVLAALRGGFAIVSAVVRWHPERVAVAGAVAVGVLSLVTVPAAWQPKQQFRAAHEFIEQERRAGDAVVALDAAAEVYELRGWTRDWRLTRTLPALEQVVRSAPRTWIVFTLRARIRALAPELYEGFSNSRFQVVRVFSSTVGDGEIHVLLHDSSSGND
jgi:mannosyltransferase